MGPGSRVAGSERKNAEIRAASRESVETPSSRRPTGDFAANERHAFDHEGIIRLNSDLVLVSANPAARRIMDIPADMTGGVPFGKLNFPEYIVDEWKRHLKSAFTTGEENTFWFSHSDGEKKRHYHVHIIPETGANGANESLLVILHDVSEVTRQEEELKAARKMTEQRTGEAEKNRLILRAIIEYIPEGIILRHFPEHGMCIVNAFVAELAGLQQNEIECSRLDNCLKRLNLRRADTPGPTHKKDFPLYRAAQKSEVILDEEWMLSRNEGNEAIILVNAGPIRTTDGTVIGGISIWRDVTGRVQAGKALRESEERYRILSEIISDYAFSIYVDPGHVLRAEWITPGFRRITGYSPEEIQSLGGMGTISHPDDAKIFKKAMRALLSGKTDLDFEYRVIVRSGDVRWLHVYAHSMTDAAGNRVNRVYGAVQDITGRKFAEEALRESEERFRHIIETADEGIWIIDDRNRTTFSNEKLAGMLGYTIDEMPGKSIYEFTDEKWKSTLNRNLTLQHKGHRGQYDFKYRRKDGSGLWAMTSASPIIDGKKYKGSFFMITDITERKRVEEELRETRDELEERVWRRTVDLERAIEDLRSEIIERKRADEELRRQTEFLQTVMNTIPVMLVFFDHSGQFRFINREFERKVGWSTQEARSADLISEIYPDPEYRDMMWNSLISASPGWRDTVIHTRSGETIECSWASVRLSDNSHIGIWIDITERRRIETALLKREREFEALVENAPDIIARFSRDLRLSYINHTIEHEIGISAQEIISKNLPELNVPDEIAERMQSKLRAVIETGREETIETGFLLPSGWRWYFSRMAPVFAPDGSVDSVLSISHNISVLKNTEEELRRHREHLQELVTERTSELEKSNRLLQQEISEHRRAEERIQRLNESLRLHSAQVLASNKELEAFSYSVSHDLRAPLRSIDGFSLALMEDYGEILDTHGKDYLQRIRSSTQRMGHLIDDLLNLSRVSRSEMRHTRINISALAREIITELKKSQPERHVEVIVRNRVFAHGDEGLLKQALANLLGNAWKFTGKTSEGKIEFGSIRQKDLTIYYVRDNGAGFDMRYVNKLFLPFQRLHSRDDFPGTGIGLAIVRRVVQRHGGRVWAEGEPEKGAAFYFTLQREG